MKGELSMKIWKTIAIAFLAVIFLGSGSALAAYPDKPITLVVPFAAGGNADILARLNAEALGNVLGVPVKVVNKPGGAHIPAAMTVLKAPADGYTLFRWSPPSFLLVPLTRKVPYKPLEDFIPLLADVGTSTVLYVRKDSPYKNFKDFIKGARAKKLAIGVNNIGAPPNLSAVQLASEFGLKFKTVVLRTVPKSLVGLIGGQVDAAVGQIASINAYKNEIRPLVILDNNRKGFFAKDLPGIPTVGEAFPGKKAGVWIKGGLAVKAGTPKAIVDKLLAATDKAYNNKKFAARVPKSITLQWIHGTEAVKKSIKGGIALYSPILKGLGMLRK